MKISVPRTPLFEAFSPQCFKQNLLYSFENKKIIQQTLLFPTLHKKINLDRCKTQKSILSFNYLVKIYVASVKG